MLALVSALIAATHPSLFFGASDVPALRQSAQTTHAAIASHITAILDQHLNDPAPTPGDYDDYRFLGNQVAVWAFAYQMTGNAQYAAMARSQLLTYADWSSWDNGETADLGGPDLNTAHMLLGNSVAYDWIYETLSAADQATIANRIGVEAEKVAAYMPDAWWVDEYLQNHNWIDTAGLGMAALVLQGEDSRASNWLSLAQGNLDMLQQTIGLIPDGSWHEGLPYEGYGLAMSLPFWQAMRRAGSDYTDMGLLRGYGLFFLYAGIPDAPRQVILPFGDFTHWPGQMVMQISRFVASRFGDGFAEAAAQRYINAVGRGNFLPELWYDVFEFIGYDATVAASDPHTLPLDGFFTDIGSAALHTTWDRGDLALGFKAGVYGGRVNFNRLAVQGSPAGGWLDWGHDHNDDMTFWLFGRGVWLAPEAMGYDAGRSTDYQYPANQTAYHNAILVDGTGQLGDTRVSDSNYGNGWFFNRVSTPLFTPTGTADYAIAGGAGAKLFATALGISRWDRIVVLARGRYALVRDDVEAASAHAYDWICHFNDGVSVDTASGWVQGIGKAQQSLGIRVLAPSSWTATTGTQTAQLMDQFDPDGQVFWVRVRPSANAANVQFLHALIPVATSQWASRTAVNRLDDADVGAGAVVAPGSPLEERWIFAGAGAVGKSAGDLVLTGSQVGMAGRDATGAPARAVLFGPGSISDQSGGRLLLSTQSANAIETKLVGTTLAVTGNPVRDFQAYAPAASAVTLNGVTVDATLSSGLVVYPAGSPPPPVDAGTPDAGTPDAGAPDAGTPDAGTPDAGTPDAGLADAGGPGDLCGNCQPPADGGSNPPFDAGSGIGGGKLPDTVSHGCSHADGTIGWLAAFVLTALSVRRRRNGT
ncbi:MAG: DUF4962 domain-containing protein [Deltaproteobacteria bacterium]|nr:MAG: DUF4962 domain-containing protein [Deltaproteobacteria bacterium]